MPAAKNTEALHPDADKALPGIRESAKKKR